MMIDLQTYTNWVSDKIKNSVVEPLNFDFNNHKFEMFIKRDDLIHPIISGNKLRKLKYNVIEAVKNQCTRLITFGGAYSNHIFATAFLCVEFNFPLTVMVRGDELNEKSNKILSFCAVNGIELIFLSRERYVELKRMNGVENRLGEKCWVIPEGGANKEGIKGASEIIENSMNFDSYVIAQGTTTTSLGIYNSMPDHATLFVVPALKKFNSKEEMKKLDSSLIFKKEITSIFYEELGRYARLSDTLRDFQKIIESETTYRFDPIYTLKALYAFSKFIYSKTENSTYDNKVLFIHTGGLNQNWWE